MNPYEDNPFADLIPKNNPFSDLTPYSSEVDYALAETGNLPEVMEAQSARRNPIVADVLKAVQARQASRPVKAADAMTAEAITGVPDIEPPEAGAPLNASQTAGMIGGQIADAVTHHLPAAIASAVEGTGFMRDGNWTDNAGLTTGFQQPDMDISQEVYAPNPVLESLIQRGREREKERLAAAGAEVATAIPGLSTQDILSLGPSLGQSVGSMASAFFGGLPSMALSTASMQRSTANRFLRDTAEALQEDYRQRTGEEMPEAMLKDKLAQVTSAANASGFWEAIPEQLGDVGAAAIMKMPFAGWLSKTLGRNVATRALSRWAGMQAPELATETVTQMGQSNVETEARKHLGIAGTDDKVRDWTSLGDWLDALKEVAAPTILQTSLFGAGAGAVRSAPRIAEAIQKNINPKGYAAQQLADAIANTDIAVGADAIARAALDPDTYMPESISPLQTVRQAGGQPQVQQPVQPEPATGSPAPVPDALMPNEAVTAQQMQQAQLTQQETPKQETLKQQQQEAPAELDNPLDVIIANGGIRRAVLENDLGWKKEQIAKLPDGVVTDNGSTLLVTKRALKKAGMDTDVQAILDAASRPEAPALEPETESEQPGQTAPMSEEQPVQNNLPDSKQVVLQNRNRSTPQAIIQMNGIASNPDYGRMSVSRDFANGAPVVFGKTGNMATGKKSYAVDSTGRRIPVTYAVVDAGDILTSNRADGTSIPDYANGLPGKLRAVAGNGRVAGLQEAYRRKTTDEYKKELLEDTDHGVPADAIRNMKEPVLVRIMPEDQVTSDIGDISNTTGTATLSPLEQAKNDARRIDISAIEFGENGISPQNVRDFVKAMPVSEQVGLMTPEGQPTKQAHDRLMAAVFQAAYEDDQLVNLYAQAADPESRTVLNGLAMAAHKMAKLKNAGEFDIRELVTEAAMTAVNAARRGERLSDYAKTRDMGRSEETDAIVQMLADNIRSANRIGESLSILADGMINALQSQDSLFGDPISRQQVFDNWRNPHGTQQRSESNLQKQERTGTPQNPDAGQDTDTAGSADATGTGRTEQEPPADTGAREPVNPFSLELPTPEQLRQQEAERTARQKREEQEKQAADKKAQADQERERFTLTGSDREADVLAAQGQESLFGAGTEREKSADLKQDKPATDISQNTAYSKQIDDLLQGRRTGSVSLGLPSEKLIKSGVANIVMRISGNTARKIVGGKHNLTSEQLKNLPALLDSPVMVFKSATDGGHVVVVDDVAMTESGTTEPIIVIIRPNGEVTANHIRSAYARNNFAQAIERWAKDGLMVSAQKEIAIDFLERNCKGLQLPNAVQAINSDSVINLSQVSNESNLNPDAGENKPDTSDTGQESAGQQETTEAEAATVSETEETAATEKAPVTAEDMQPHAVESGQASLIEEPQAKQEETDTKQKIEDSGRKIRARKDEYAFLETMKKDADDESLSLSKHFPEPDYAALIEDGVSEDTLAVFKMIRDEIPPKPRYPKNPARWASAFRMMRDMATDLIEGKRKIEDFIAGMGTEAKDKLALYKGVGYPAFTRIKSLKYSLHKYNGIYKILEGGYIVDSHTNLTDAIENIKKRITADMEKSTGKKREIKLDIYRIRGKDDIIIGKIIGSGKHVVLKDGFKTRREAAEYIAENEEVLQKQWEALKKDPAVRRAENLPRTGKDRRGGKDITQKQFMETFGFSGDTYGNWVSQKERQAFLNNTYDALMDLSEVLDISPKAISLNGELGIQFGASGKAGANAHYRLDDVSINLTKKKGAGSLAHEWFHALDNYFSRMGGKPEGMLTEGASVDDNVRQEIRKAFREIRDIFAGSDYEARSTRMDATRKTPYWSTRQEMGARAFEAYIITKAEGLDITNDFLANIIGEESFQNEERYPYPTGKEKEAIDKAFDKLFNTIEEKETDKGIALFSRSRKKDTTGRGLSVEAVQRGLDDIKQWYRNAPELVVVEKTSDLPFDAPNNVQGAYWGKDGRCYFVSSKITNAAEIRDIFGHEVLRHFGLRYFFGDRLNAELDFIFVHNKNVQESAHKWIKDNTDFIRKVREENKGKWSHEQFAQWKKYRAIEEALAHMKGNITGIKKLVYAIQKLLRAIGLNKLADSLEARTDAEALMMLHKAEVFVKGKEVVDPEVVRHIYTNFLHDPDVPLFSRQSEESGEAPESFAVPKVTVLDNALRAWQDDDIDIRRVQDAIVKSGGSVTENTDVYLGRTLYTSKVTDRLERLNKEWTKPILEAVKKSGLTLEEAGDWLYARHVIEDEVNAKLAEINPDREDNEALSGMTDDEAQEILARHKDNMALQELGELADRLAKKNIQWLVQGGLITREEGQAWAQKYRHYVPLKRDDETSGTPFSRLVPERPERSSRPSGANNMQVKGAESRRRMGSTRRATNILANLLGNVSTTIIRSEKAAIGRQMLDLARANPNPDFWSVDTPKREKRINKETGLVEYVSANPKEHAFVTKENGVEHHIVFNEKSKRAMEVLNAMKALDAPRMLWVLRATGSVTRYMGQYMTSRNPAFMFFNFKRDVQHAMFNLSDTPLSGKEWQVLKNILPAMRQYHNLVRGDGENSGYAEEFKEAGAETGYIMPLDVEGRVKDLQKELDRMNRGKADPRSWAEAAVNLVDDYNSIVENGVRLAVYTVARENGQTIREAARIAKEITVDFNRRGKYSSAVNALWLFTNANIQGHARMIRAICKSKKARVMAAALVGMGFVMDVIGRALLGDDDETGKKVWDEIPEHVKERNWVIPLPWKTSGQKYMTVTVPFAQGLHVLTNFGRMLSELCFSSKDKDLLQMASRMAVLVADAFNPFGAAGSFSQAVMPTVARPIAQVYENVNSFGQKLYKEESAFGGYTPPAHQRAWKSTPEHWTAVSKAISDITGGDDVVGGKIDIPPEAIRHVLTSYLFPGMSTVVDRSIGTAVAKEKAGLNQIPVVNRIIREVPDEKEKEHAVYERISDMRKTVNAIHEYEKQGRLDDARRLVRKLGDGNLSKGNRVLNHYDDFMEEIRSLNREKRQAEKEKNANALKVIDAQRKHLFNEFLNRM